MALLQVMTWFDTVSYVFATVVLLTVVDLSGERGMTGITPAAH
jgi:hypothetical protein